MTENPSELPVFFLKTGQMYITDKPRIVKTVLGSCLAITMYSGSRRISAVCHAMSPTCSCYRCENKDNKMCSNCPAADMTCKETCPELFKYVDCSIQNMAHRFKKLGIKQHDIEVKMFGGADMFGKNNAEATRFSVGRQNIATALQMLDNEHLILKNSDTGGHSGRKLLFYTHSGEVLVKHIHSKS